MPCPSSAAWGFGRSVMGRPRPLNPVMPVLRFLPGSYDDCLERVEYNTMATEQELETSGSRRRETTHPRDSIIGRQCPDGSKSPSHAAGPTGGFQRASTSTDTTRATSQQKPCSRALWPGIWQHAHRSDIWQSHAQRLDSVRAVLSHRSRRPSSPSPSADAGGAAWAHERLRSAR